MSDRKFFVLVVFFIGIFCIGCCSTLAYQEQKQRYYFDSQENINKALHSTVALLFRDEDGEPEYVYCTAFFVSPTILVTARHCIMDETEEAALALLKKTLGDDADLILESLDIGKQYRGKKVEIVPYSSYNTDMATGETQKAEIVHLTAKKLGDTSHDIAILELLDTYAPSKYWFTIAPKFPKIGEKVNTVGMPFQLPWVISNGMLSQIMWDWNQKPKVLASYVVNILIAPGASGSPLLDSKGQLIGMAVVQLSKYPMGLFAPLSTITKYIQDAKVIIAKEKQASTEATVVMEKEQ